MKKRIESLTKDQVAKFPDYIREWTNVGLSTEAADRPRAEVAIRRMYESAGLPPPAKIVWCGSPLSQGLTRKIVVDHGSTLAGKNVRDSVGASVWDSVGDSVWDSVGASVRDSVWDSVGDSVWDSVGASVRDSVWDSVGASVWDSVRASVGASVGASVRASVGASVGASVWDSVRASVGDSVWDSVGASVRDSVYGQHDANWLAFYKFFQTECGLEEETKMLEGLWELCRSGGWALPHANICWVCERHCIVLRDDRGRLHSTRGAALEYPDGFAIHAVHGVRVPPFVVLEPEKITAELIEKESNAEVRRVMIDQYVGGQAKFLMDAGAKAVHSDDYGTLYRKEIPGDEDIVMVKCINSTAEPDGSFKEYFLRVPPTVQTAREAIGWTFDKSAAEYEPAIQT